MMRPFLYVVSGVKYIKRPSRTKRGKTVIQKVGRTLELPPFTSREKARAARRDLKIQGYRVYFARYEFANLNYKGR